MSSIFKRFVVLVCLPGRLKELSETHRKVEQEIKIAVFTLINEINKKGKSLLQQLEVRLPRSHTGLDQTKRQLLSWP